ncbi:phosphate propanoyltransferase [Neobacillus niacini]|uniref:phosphate propanoyltransferase n=1 Tax=Neobacillus niacini TaxID=86668 RepID=UPI0021CB4F41|nr:phosphate propanoyltransferase [Neobacillus niacini]MCM3768524.1 phosphate propanoyltransferase [Neobacillus niacini]
MALITEKFLRNIMAQQKLSKEFLLQEGDKLTPSAKDFLMDRKISIVQPGSSESAPHLRLTIPVGVSNRHVHLTEKHFHVLFGETEGVTELRPLSQPGQFAARETVTIVGPSGVIRNVRILGPFRGLTQVEISRTDGFTLGIHPQVRLSGSIDGTPGITLVGPEGAVTLQEGLIVAKNHVHMSGADAQRFDVKHGDSLMLGSEERRVIFQDVIVRVKDSYILDFHVDQDEANAAGLSTGDRVVVLGKNRRFYSPYLGVLPDG